LQTIYHRHLLAICHFPDLLQSSLLEIGLGVVRLGVENEDGKCSQWLWEHGYRFFETKSFGEEKEYGTSSFTGLAHAE
jgi:hypothetical protein